VNGCCSRVTDERPMSRPRRSRHGPFRRTLLIAGVMTPTRWSWHGFRHELGKPSQPPPPAAAWQLSGADGGPPPRCGQLQEFGSATPNGSRKAGNGTSGARKSTPCAVDRHNKPPMRAREAAGLLLERGRARASRRDVRPAESRRHSRRNSKALMQSQKAAVHRSFCAFLLANHPHESAEDPKIVVTASAADAPWFAARLPADVAR
jgi:hypothetical protein